MYSNLAGVVSGVKVSDGSISWSVTLDGPVRGSLALSPDGNTIYAGDSDGKIYGIPSSGSNNGTLFYLDGTPLSSPSVDQNGNIYIATNTGVLDSFSSSNSTPRWAFVLSGHSSSLSTPALVNNAGNVLAIIGSGNGILYAVNTSTGQQAWQAHPSSSAIESSPAVATSNNMVYFGSDDGSAYGYDLTGKQIWVRPVGGFLTASPGLGSDGSAWFASAAGLIARVKDLPPPATPPSTSTPGPSATPTITSTAGPTETPTATPTPTTPPTPPITISLKGSARPRKQADRGGAIVA